MVVKVRCGSRVLDRGWGQGKESIGTVEGAGVGPSCWVHARAGLPSREQPGSPSVVAAREREAGVRGRGRQAQ